jgi:hypothetical protein
MLRHLPREHGCLRCSQSDVLASGSIEARGVLTEDQVVDAVCRMLVDDGYVILARAVVTQHGHDIVGVKDGTTIIIEAKGAGSSKIGTARFGQVFTRNQVFDHVAKAVLKAMRIVSAGEARAAIALPDDANHQREVAQVARALSGAGIGVFWVSATREVRLDAPWLL